MILLQLLGSVIIQRARALTYAHTHTYIYKSTFILFAIIRYILQQILIFSKCSAIADFRIEFPSTLYVYLQSV